MIKNGKRNIITLLPKKTCKQSFVSFLTAFHKKGLGICRRQFFVNEKFTIMIMML